MKKKFNFIEQSFVTYNSIFWPAQSFLGIFYLFYPLSLFNFIHLLVNLFLLFYLHKTFLHIKKELNSIKKKVPAGDIVAKDAYLTLQVIFYFLFFSFLLPLLGALVVGVLFAITQATIPLLIHYVIVLLFCMTIFIISLIKNSSKWQRYF
jgi:hypothetical protein